MKPKHYLVVGASSVAGQKAIEAIRQKDAAARITVTTSKSEGGAAGFDVIHSVDLAKPDSIRNIKPALKAPVDVMVFCPAFGMVGYPSALAPIADKSLVTEDFDALVAAIVAEARDGDRILVMSNGGFGGIHGKLLAALAD